MFKQLKSVHFFPVIFALAVTLLVVFKIFLTGFYPVPADLLVSFYFPWYSGGWDGYDPWTSHKALIAFDSIRQHIPWHSFTFSQLKSGILPLWNPYNFSGTPHLANIQTFIFYPLNILFFALPLFNAWIILIISQIFLAVLFTYLFASSLGLSRSSSALASLGYAFSSFMLFWLEMAIVGHTIIWLPLILYSIQKLHLKFEKKYLLILILASTAAIFSGHIQTAIYIFIASAAFWLTKSCLSIKNTKSRIDSLMFFASWGIVTFLITSIQTIPMIELYVNSPLTEAFSKEAFAMYTMPFKNTLTLFAPDFFGNPATLNFWSTIYGDGTPHVGVIPLFFAVFALIASKRWEAKFFSITALFFYFFATRGPVFLIVENLDIPFLTGTSSARTTFIFAFALSILAGLGLDAFLKRRKELVMLFYYLIAGFLLIYVFLWLLTFLIPIMSPDPIWKERLKISQHNLILPTLIFLSLPFAYLSSKFIFPKIGLKIFMLVILLSTIFGGIYQSNKILPFSPKKFFFPKHDVTSWLNENAGINRFFGVGTASLATNFATFYKINSPEGYGVFRIKRYAELVESQKDGKLPKNYERAVAEFPNIDTQNRRRLFDLMGVKYLLTKDDMERDATTHEAEKPENDVKIAWQKGKFRIYEREKTLPRYFLSSQFIVESNPQAILDRIYDPNHDLKTLILEEKPLEELGSEQGQTSLISYKPNKSEFDTNSSFSTLFFISDTHYPGWNAYLDGEETKIYRANYAFRAVEVPQGSHRLIFKYQPMSVKLGILGTTVGIVSLTLFLFVYKKEEKIR